MVEAKSSFLVKICPDDNQKHEEIEKSLAYTDKEHGYHPWIHRFLNFHLGNNNW